MKIAEVKLGDVGMLTDEKLLYLCTKFGARALKWRGRFLGLLPEANRRRIFEKKGFDSIFEFAYKLAGLSEEQVRLLLRLDLKFENKPMLKGLLVAGEVSVSKLARVASVATAENEQEWAEVVNILPRGALETLVRDQKVIDERQKLKDERCEYEGANGLNKPLFEYKSVPGHGLTFEISEEVARELNQLNSLGHDVNKIILEMLKKRKMEIEEKKEQLGEEAIASMEAKKAAFKPGKKLKKSSYVSVKVKAVLKEEYGEKCSVPGCCKPADVNHHSQRRSLVGIDDPRYMAPLCKDHHQIAHMIDQKYVTTLLQRSGG